MKKQLAVGLAATLCAVGAGVVLAGQEQGAEKPQLFCIYKEIVKPALVEQYETGIKHMISEFRAYEIDPEKVNWTAFSGPEMGYVYVMPIESFAGMDQMKLDWMEAIDRIGKDKFDDMMASVEAAIESIEVLHAAFQPELSYTPENPRLKPEEVKYIHYGFYYGIPGQTEKIEAAARKFAALYERLGIDTGFRVYKTVTGSDLPLYVVAKGAKDAVDFETNRVRIKELLGEEGAKIGEMVTAAVRRIEYKEAMPRPELCYPGPEALAHSHEGHGDEGRAR